MKPNLNKFQTVLFAIHGWVVFFFMVLGVYVTVILLAIMFNSWIPIAFGVLQFVIDVYKHFVMSKQKFTANLPIYKKDEQEEQEREKISLEDAKSICRLMFANDYRPDVVEGESHKEWYNRFEIAFENVSTHFIKRKNNGN